MTFIQAAEIVLKQNSNKPMSANEIWNQIKEQNLLISKGRTPVATLGVQLSLFTSNSNIAPQTLAKRNPKGLVLFDAIGSNPIKWQLTNTQVVVSPTKSGLVISDPPYSKPLSVWQRILNWFQSR